MYNNEAVFVLADATLLKSLLPQQRKDMAYFAFPGSQREDSAWRVGSLFYLAVPEDAPNRRGARRLVEYLSSEDVAKRFRQSSGVEVLRAESVRAGTQLIPSITQRVREPEMRPFLNWLTKQNEGRPE